MIEPEVFVLADQALDRVVAQIRDEHWDEVVPSWFVTSSRVKDPTLRDLINYHAYDDAWVPDMLAGKTMAEVGVEMHKGDLLGDAPINNFHRIMKLAVAAAREVGEGDLQRTVHCSFGDFTMQHYFWQVNQFRAIRAWEIATWIGVDAFLPDSLVQGIWDEVAPNVEQWREIGVFPAAVEVPASAPLLDRLLGITGRDPYVKIGTR